MRVFLFSNNFVYKKDDKTLLLLIFLQLNKFYNIYLNKKDISYNKKTLIQQELTSFSS